MSVTFNAELAYRVLDVIDSLEGGELVHDQGVWRNARATGTDRCQTAMCFAGWTVELEGKWLFTHNDVSREVRGTSLSGLVVLEEHNDLAWQLGEEQLFPVPVLQRELVACSLSNEDARVMIKRTHGEVTGLKIAMVDDWARFKLGLGDDPLGLFSEWHSRLDLRTIVNHYAWHGTSNEAADVCFSYVAYNVNALDHLCRPPEVTA